MTAQAVDRQSSYEEVGTLVMNKLIQDFDHRMIDQNELKNMTRAVSVIFGWLKQNIDEEKDTRQQGGEDLEE